jgi:glutamate synthase domain-containing protein 3
MTNGIAYVIDEAGTFASRVNGDMVELGELDSEDAGLLHRLILEHEQKTVSVRARNILVRWEEYLPLFRKVIPKGAAQQAAATLATYLSSTPDEIETSLVRRTA